MKKLKIGVVGVGHIGKNHARIYSELPQVELAAVYDTDFQVAGEIAEKYHTYPARSLEEFSGLVEAASVATPTQHHFAVASLLLEKGRHVLVEKPITDNTRQAYALVELAQRFSLILQAGHVERFNPALSVLEKCLTRPRFIEVHRLSPFPNRSTDIDVVLDLMIHDLDVVLYLVNSHVENIDAVGIPVLSPKAADIANARLRFANGCIANITASRISQEKMRKIRIFQPETYISLDYQNQTGQVFRRKGDQIDVEPVQIKKDEPLKCQLSSFVECCIAGGNPKVSGRQAAKALELAASISQTIEKQNAGDALLRL